MSMRNNNRLLALSVTTALLCADATAQHSTNQNAATPHATASARPIAFTNARILTVSGKVIENGTLVIKSGKIEAVGSDVVVPAGAKVIDASGKTIMPGLVNAWSHAGLDEPQARGNTPQRGGRRGNRRPQQASNRGGSTSGNAATKVIDGIYTRQSIFGELLE